MAAISFAHAQTKHPSARLNGIQTHDLCDTGELGACCLSRHLYLQCHTLIDAAYETTLTGIVLLPALCGFVRQETLLHIVYLYPSA